MDINVKILEILPAQSFAKRDGSQGVRYGFVGETTTGAYDKKVKFDVLSQDMWVKMDVKSGVVYNVSFDVESREWNGRWFTSCNAWRAVAMSQPDVPNNAPNPVPATPTTTTTVNVDMPANDGLPF